MLFNRNPPAILVVDDFFSDPEPVRRLALNQVYETDDRYFKGRRSKKKFLFPYMKEEFERLLGLRITDWMQQPANGSFQLTSEEDPLVWHSDTQHYAAAIYLTPNATGAGTSFWQHAGGGLGTGLRRPSLDPEVNASMYSEHNLLHSDNWRLIDRVGHVYNRLVLWDAQLVHSATTYRGFSSEPDQARLVQLFFFNVAR